MLGKALSLNHDSRLEGLPVGEFKNAGACGRRELSRRLKLNQSCIALLTAQHLAAQSVELLSQFVLQEVDAQ